MPKESPHNGSQGMDNRQTIKRLDVSWKRAKHWITSPDPVYARKKTTRDRLIGYAAARAD